MNPSKAIEIALAAMVRNHADIGGKTLIRPWQSLNVEGAFDPKDDRTFPCVDIRCENPASNAQNIIAFDCAVSVTSMTYADDDRNHQQVSAINSEVLGVVMEIFMDFMGESNNGYFAEFAALVNAEDGVDININGITLLQGMPPSDDGNAIGIGTGLNVHFTYA
jgi:hypothetical protein